MGLTIREKRFSEKEHILFELQSDIKHEYINGKLIEIPGESDLHNQLALNFCIILKALLKNKGYSFFVENVKVKVPHDNKYFYPDVFITKEPISRGTVYIKERPELIVEVLSESTRKYVTIDKFINYQRFETLQYYILAEPATIFVSVFSRSSNDWTLDTYSKGTDIIELPNLGISFTVGEIYIM